ncbi:MAG: DUF1573 domain-containing protein [Acidobacteria bacterium]|nr:DUF1573 domain-containing protein [Acidobacteriota bacterium]
MKFMVTVVIAIVMSFPAFAGAEIQFEKLNVNAGTLHPNSRAEIVFKFKNAGDATLKISKVNAACGCTVPRINKREFAPGESGELLLWFYTAGYYGKVNKTATIMSNSQSNPVVTVSFNAVVKAELLPDQTKIEFRNVVPGKAVEKVITIGNRMNRPAKLGKGRVLFGKEHMEETGLKWKASPLANGDLALRFELCLKPGIRAGRPIHMKVAFSTNSKLDPELIFYLTIRPMPSMAATPSSFFLPGLVPGAKHVAAIHVNSTGGQKLVVDRVQLPGRVFSYEIEVKSETSSIIWLNVKDSAESGRLQGGIQVVATVAGSPRMRIIPVKAQIR